MGSFGVVDYAVFGGMVIGSGILGLVMGNSKKNNAAQFLTGSGDISTVPVALSMLAGWVQIQICINQLLR